MLMTITPEALGLVIAIMGTAGFAAGALWMRERKHQQFYELVDDVAYTVEGDHPFIDYAGLYLLEDES